MQAATYQTFSGPITIKDVSDPVASPNGVIIEVKATGICRSDWYGWKGYDSDITLPHVPGHELAGIVSVIGENVKNWKQGDRVTLPFVCGCGMCDQCISGNQQVCDNQFQPGFTHWGSFAEYVAIEYANVNLVRLPDDMDYETAASLGCRFATSFRAIVQQGKVAKGKWVAVYGSGGAGLARGAVPECREGCGLGRAGDNRQIISPRFFHSPSPDAGRRRCRECTSAARSPRRRPRRPRW